MKTVLMYGGTTAYFLPTRVLSEDEQLLAMRTLCNDSSMRADDEEIEAMGSELAPIHVGPIKRKMYKYCSE